MHLLLLKTIGLSIRTDDDRRMRSSGPSFLTPKTFLTCYKTQNRLYPVPLPMHISLLEIGNQTTWTFTSASVCCRGLPSTSWAAVTQKSIGHQLRHSESVCTMVATSLLSNTSIKETYILSSLCHSLIHQSFLSLTTTAQ